MTLKARFTLIGMGLVIFLIITPFLVLFARGFKIDWDNRQIVKTGTVVIKTEPEKAKVYLNDKLEKKDTPYTGRFILPGNYVVRVEKDGYQSWTKRLSVIPQLVTWANLNREYLTLFLQEPQMENEEKTEYVFISKDHKQLAYSKDGQLYFLDTSKNDIDLAGPIATITPPLNFNQKLSWVNGRQVYNQFKNISLPSLPISQIEKIDRMESNGDYTVFQIDGQLYLVDSKNEMVLLDTQVSNFTLDGENVWYLQGSAFKSQNLRSRNQNFIAQNLPSYTEGLVIRGEGRLFLILDGSLYTINDTLERIYEGILHADWDSISKKLVFSNNNEILIFDPARKQTELMVRTISPIQNPELNWKTGYVFFANEGKVKAIELDGRDHRNIYTIAELDSGTSDNFTVSEDGKRIYIYNSSQIKTYLIR